MTIILLLILISVFVAITFLLAFFWAVKSGQYEDTDSPSVRMLIEDSGKVKNKSKLKFDDKTTNR